MELSSFAGLSVIRQPGQVSLPQGQVVVMVRVVDTEHQDTRTLSLSHNGELTYLPSYFHHHPAQHNLPPLPPSQHQTGL